MASDNFLGSDPRRSLQFTLGTWLVAIVAFNAAWEFAHAPLYRFPAGLDDLGRAWAIVHCTFGDALIAIIVYGLTALIVRSGSWLTDRSIAGTLVFVVCALAYTGYSEWLNVYGRGSWGYLPAMPTILGIGVSPLAQWVVIPILATLVVRGSSHRRARRH